MTLPYKYQTFVLHHQFYPYPYLRFSRNESKKQKKTKKQKQFNDDGDGDDDDDDDEEADHVRPLHRSIVTIETIFVFAVAVGKCLNDQKHQQSWDKKQQQD